MKIKLVVLALLFLGISEVKAQDLKAVDLPEDIQLVLDNYEKFWGEKDAEALAGLFTEDGFVLSPGSKPTQGKEAIQKAYEGKGGPLFLKAYDFEQQGDLAYIVGGYSGVEHFPAQGKFTLILKKVNGKWLIHSDMDNGNQPF